MGAADIAWSYFSLLNDQRIDDAAAVLDPEGSWWTCGTRTARPMAEHLRLFPRVVAKLPMRYELLRSFEVPGEGSTTTVLLEMTSQADLPDGVRYANVYAFVFEVAGDRIVHVREYSDTAHLAVVAPTIKALYADG